MLNKGAMFGLEVQALKKQSGRLFLARLRRLSFRLVEGQQATRVRTSQGAMFGLDARIALAIFGALSVISGAALYSAIQDSKVTSLYTQLTEIAKAYEAYYIDTGQHAPRASDILDARALFTKTTETNWKGPYFGTSAPSNADLKTNTPYMGGFRVFESDTWGPGTALTPDIYCDAGDVCSVWTVLFSVEESLAFAIDEKFDDNDYTTGNIRLYNTTGARHVWFKVMPFDN